MRAAALLGGGSPDVLAAVLALSRAADTTPPDSQVSPGLIGFLATFAVVLVTVLLLLDLVRRLRRLKHRQEVAEREEQDRARAATPPQETPPEPDEDR